MANKKEKKRDIAKYYEYQRSTEQRGNNHPVATVLSQASKTRQDKTAEASVPNSRYGVRMVTS